MTNIFKTVHAGWECEERLGLVEKTIAVFGVVAFFPFENIFFLIVFLSVLFLLLKVINDGIIRSSEKDRRLVFILLVIIKAILAVVAVLQIMYLFWIYLPGGTELFDGTVFESDYFTYACKIMCLIALVVFYKTIIRPKKLRNKKPVN